MARPPADWPDIVFSSDGSRAALSKAAKEGRMVRLASGIYSSRRFAKPEEVVLRNWHQILAHELPGAIITDRSIRRSGPDQGVLTVVHRRRRPLELPGLTIMPRPGEGPQPGDIETDGVYLASEARGLLENLAGQSRRTRYLSKEEIETWLADLALQPGGTHRLNDIRDNARSLAASAAAWDEPFHRLDSIIGAALGTRETDNLSTNSLLARAKGQPYDHQRADLFDALAAALADLAPSPLPILAADADRRRLLPFYEAYFSNYIEGTEFTLDEAAGIVFEEQVPEARPADAHDILGTYRLVADDAEARRTPATSSDFLALLLERHGVLMAGRPDNRPGLWKTRANRAGSTVFVQPDLVEATLVRGFEAATPLLDPFARAAMLGFVVAEVHPFVDGNGRMSRIMMNAELSAGGDSRIIIPTLYRDDYLGGMRTATNGRNFGSYVAVLRFAQRYSAQVDFSSRQSAEADLVRTNALRQPSDADLYGVRLLLPSSVKAQTVEA